MDFTHILPKPIRNIVQNCIKLQSNAQMTEEKRTQAIHAIALDVFRILMAIPIAAFSFASGGMGLIGALAFSPSYMIAIGTACLVGTVALLVQAIAMQALFPAALAICFGIFGATILENYDKDIFPSFLSLEEHVLAPIANQFVKAFN